MSESSPIPTTTRRDFARTLAALAVTAPLAQACARRIEPESPVPEPVPTPPPPAAATPQPAQPAQQQQPPPAETEALMQVIQIRYGAQLSEDQLEAVRRDVVGGLRAAERLRRVAVANGVGPACVYAACRAQG
ncbi:MAG: hypothetical protein HY561_04885 [Gemmatimonadetes bacterium]|nr:hypothetical protein [Gemmatimonadota bacterium]